VSVLDAVGDRCGQIPRDDATLDALAGPYQASWCVAGTPCRTRSGEAEGEAEMVS
jgi:hypothetical protein